MQAANQCDNSYDDISHRFNSFWWAHK